MSSRRKRSEELFQVAVDLSPEECTSFLDEQCAADPELRSDVEKLLQVNARIEVLMQTPENTAVFLDPPQLTPLDVGEGGAEGEPLDWGHPELIDSKLGHYTVEREIGRGGMGTVYLAEDTQLGRPAAIKLLPDQFSHDPKRLAMFEREARTAANLNHPNIGTVYEFGEVDGSYYIAMEYVEGRMLAELHEGSQPIPTLQLLDIAVQIAEGLTAAHEANVVHRDLKPGNVMITAESRVKILDFGLAKALRDEPQVSDNESESTEEAIGVSAVYGTAGYASPEQCEGAAIDLRSDLFSFGVVLYELATGVAPFRRDNFMATHRAVRDAVPEPPKSVNPALPRAISELIEKLLQKRPEDRFETCGEVLRLLKRYKRREEAKVYGKRRRRRLVALVVALVAIPTLAAVWGLTRLPPSTVTEVDYAELDALVADDLAAACIKCRWIADELPDSAAWLAGEQERLVPLLQSAVAEEREKLLTRAQKGDLKSAGDACREIRDLVEGSLVLAGVDNVEQRLEADERVVESESLMEEAQHASGKVDAVAARFTGVSRSVDQYVTTVRSIVEELDRITFDEKKYGPAGRKATNIKSQVVTEIGRWDTARLTSLEMERLVGLLQDFEPSSDAIFGLDSARRETEYLEKRDEFDRAVTVNALDELSLPEDARYDEFREEVKERKMLLKACENLQGDLDSAFRDGLVAELDDVIEDYQEIRESNQPPAVKKAAGELDPTRVRDWLRRYDDADQLVGKNNVLVGEQNAEPRRLLFELGDDDLLDSRLGRLARQKLDELERKLDESEDLIRLERIELEVRNGQPGAERELQEIEAAGERAISRKKEVQRRVELFKRVDEGVSALDEGFTKLLKTLDSDPPKARRDLLRLEGEFQELAGDLPSAIKESLGPLHDRLVLSEGTLRLRFGEYENVIENPGLGTSLEGLLLRGLAFFLQGDEGKAREHFEQAGLHDSRRDRVRFWLGVVAQDDAQVGVLHPQSVHASLVMARKLSDENGSVAGVFEYATNAIEGPLCEDDVFVALGGYANAAETAVVRGFRERAREVRATALERAYQGYLDRIAERDMVAAESLLGQLESCWRVELADLVDSLSGTVPSLLLRQAELHLMLGEFDEAQRAARESGESVESLLLRAEAIVAADGGTLQAGPGPKRKALGLVDAAFGQDLSEPDRERARILRGRLWRAVTDVRARVDLLAAPKEGEMPASSGVSYDLGVSFLDPDFEDVRPDRALELLGVALETKFTREDVFVGLGGNRPAIGKNIVRFRADVILQMANANARLADFDACIALCERCLDECEGTFAMVDGPGIFALGLKAGVTKDVRLWRTVKENIPKDAEGPLGKLRSRAVDALDE